jgi:glutathione S-transferase
MLTVWGRRSSFNVQKVMWLVGELQLPHQHIEAGGRFGGLDDPAFLQMNPHGRVPVLRDGDTTVWESHAILRYLAARYGDERFWSAVPADRSQADRWMDCGAHRVAAGFPRGRILGFLPDPGGQAKLAGNPRRAWALRAGLCPA